MYVNMSDGCVLDIGLRRTHCQLNMQLKLVSILVCLLVCAFQLSEAGRLRGVPATTRSWRESLESFEKHDTVDMVETFTPSTLAGRETICMPKKRYETTLRVIDRMKDYMKTVEQYMDTCARLSDAVRDRNNG